MILRAGDFFRIAGTSFGVFQHVPDYSAGDRGQPRDAGEAIIGYATGLPTATRKFIVSPATAIEAAVAAG